MTLNIAWLSLWLANKLIYFCMFLLSDINQSYDLNLQLKKKQFNQSPQKFIKTHRSFQS